MILAALSAAALNLTLLFLLFTPLERLFPARAQRLWRAESRLDLAFFLGQYLLFGGAAVALLSWVERSLRDAGLSLSPPANGALPAWAIAGAAVLLGDALVYWFHRACHRFDLLWRFHAVHHSSKELDWLAAHREHPLDGLVTQLLQNLPAVVLGVPFELLAGLAVFRGAWAVFIHSNVRLPTGPLGFLFGAPELHHFHHARVRETRHNFANLAPWLDWVFGTYRRPGPELEPELELGLNEPFPRGYLAQLAAPFARSAGERASVEPEIAARVQ